MFQITKQSVQICFKQGRGNDQNDKNDPKSVDKFHTLGLKSIKQPSSKLSTQATQDFLRQPFGRYSYAFHMSVFT